MLNKFLSQDNYYSRYNNGKYCTLRVQKTLLIVISFNIDTTSK